MKPVRVRLSRAKGWRMPPNTVSVARPSIWGNPWRVGVDGDAAHCVEQYERRLRDVAVAAWPKEEPWRSRAVNAPPAELAAAELRGKNLACWCKITSHGVYQPCHADVLISLANDIPMSEVRSENVRRAESKAP